MNPYLLTLLIVAAAIVGLVTGNGIEKEIFAIPWRRRT
jgi:hypothetical protein